MNVEVPARPARENELVSVSVSAKGRTSRRRRPCAVLADRARELGWQVRGPLYARGPITRGRRQEEPNADGVRPTIEVTEPGDSYGLALADPSGRRLAALWAAGKVEAWQWVECDHPAGRCPRRDDGSVKCNARRLSSDELKALVEAGPQTEGEPPVPEAEQERKPIGRIVAEAGVAFDEWDADRMRREEMPQAPRNLFVDGFVEGYARAAGEHGDAYGEGYAAGVASLAGMARVWVKARRRLDELGPGDVILGKGDRWWVVASTGGRGGQVAVVATSADDERTVVGERSRRVDVVEELVVADALATLKSELGAKVSRGTEGAAA